MLATEHKAPRAKPRMILAIVSGITIFYALLVTYSLYAKGYYGFHDAGLINDWFANAIKGKPFFISQYGWNHLGKHFTPSLLLLLPFYLITESQFVLLFVSSLCLGWVFYELLRFAEAYLCWQGRESLTQTKLFWLTLLLSFFLVHNPYLKSVLVTGHFEILFIPLAVRLGRLYLSQASAFSYYSVLLVAAGIRQDAALFLGALILGLAWHGRGHGQRPYAWKRLFWSGVILTVYFVLVVKVIMPLFGSDQNVTLWSSWGENYGAIAWSMASQPEKLLETLKHSGLGPLLLSFGLLPLGADPLSFILSHLPSLLLYTMDHHERRYLYWYNGAFLIPSCLLFSLITFLQIAKVLKIKSRPLLWNLSLAAIVCAILVTFSWTAPGSSSPAYVVHKSLKQGLYVRSARIHELLRKCDKNAKVAGDFYLYTYLPLSFEKYLLDRWTSVDVAVYDPSYNPGLPYMVEPSVLESGLKERGFTTVYSSTNLVVSVSNQSRACTDLRLTAASRPVQGM